jgi:hypothetical protein
MQSLLKFLAYFAKAFGISSPSDNARKPISWKEKQHTPTPTSPDEPSLNKPRGADSPALFVRCTSRG